MLEVDKSVTMPLIVVKDPKSDGLIFKKDLTLKGKYKKLELGNSNNNKEQILGSGSKKVITEGGNMDEEERDTNKRTEYII